MFLMTLLASQAQAGFVAGATVGPAVPLQKDTESETGMSVGGLVGYRAGLGPLHLRPEATFRHNTGSQTSALSVGGAATFGALLSVGPYAHLGMGLGGGEGTGQVADAGAVAELGLKPLPLMIGASLGWERTRPQKFTVDPDATGTYKVYPRYAENWFVAQLTVAVNL
ncbi:MAG: hypothetical protein R3F59_07355 [Myxococcota bacterium]